MAIHVDFDAVASGLAWRDVTCEKCRKPYHYALTREAQASVRAAYGLLQASAEDRAAKTAEYRLVTKLERGLDLVPCPACGWYQDDMVREGRRRTARWLIGVAALCLLGGLAMAVFPLGELLFVTDPEITAAEKSRATVGFLIGAGAAVALLIIRRMIQSSVNPNAAYPKKPKPVPGTPVGMPGKAPRAHLGRVVSEAD